MPVDDESRRIAVGALGAIQRLALCLDHLAERDNREPLPEWLDDDGRLSVWARDLEEVPRLLVRIAEYLTQLRGRGVSIAARVSRDEQVSLDDEFLSDVENRKVLTAEGGSEISTSVRDLRNVLEHQADYVAGQGRRRELVQDVNERLTYSYTLGPFELRSISVFGVQYEVGRATGSAIELFELLKELVQE